MRTVERRAKPDARSRCGSGFVPRAKRTSLSGCGGRGQPKGDIIKTNAMHSRLTSLDALRGFDMFWIIGARAIVNGVAGLGVPFGRILAHQLTHSDWNGFTFYDLIFPLFLFIVGVSLVFAVRRRLQKGQSRREILRHVVFRSLVLFALGLFYNGGLSQTGVWENLRFMGVLQRAALVYFFSSLLVLYTRPRTQALAVGAILVGYWAALRFIPVPGHPAGLLTPTVNLVRYVDLRLLPGEPYWGTWDPEGILSTVPAVATGLLGALTGHWLRASTGPRGGTLTPPRRAGYLLAAGALLALLGLLAGLVFPINKSLWTSSYVLLTGGLSAMLLAVFYWLIDVCGHRRWAFPFVVIGMNSLFIYLADNMIPFGDLARRLVGGDVADLFGPGRLLFLAFAELALEWLLLWWMYRRRIFIRI